ncbi:MAG TPA: barstar family protein [Mucilaginibacter sp.]|jgi:RNAse (barnase) inhibitor barstar|nr:barstar family protein [Mucilaginibacter sp.]
MQTEQINNLRDSGYFVGVIDGAECADLRSSIANIAKAFHFPSYYGENLDAFDECINDLDWLNESNYAIVIKNANLFMEGDTRDNKIYLMDLLDKISKEWANVPNFQNEDSFRKKADFKVIYI